MRKIMTLYILLALLTATFWGCASKAPIVESNETEMPVEDRIVLLEEFLSGNCEEMETIARTLLKYKNEGIQVKNGVLCDSFGEPRNVVSREDDALIVDFFSKQTPPIQYVYTDMSRRMIDADICIFDNGRYSKDGILCNVMLIYCETTGFEGKNPFYFMPIDEHWQICIEYFDY